MKKRCIHDLFFPAWHQIPQLEMGDVKTKKKGERAGPGRYFQINSIDRRDFKCPQC